ncbi:hypothetical protein F4805DRAFT_472770 [Annulohypoxylon moriforme]|nr:hypothetical protein F4805DRAFT_472770 [Annulohypoxylon moriforme]
MSRNLDHEQVDVFPSALADLLRDREKMLAQSFKIIDRLQQDLKEFRQGNKEPSSGVKNLVQADAQNAHSEELEKSNLKLREENAELRSMIRDREYRDIDLLAYEQEFPGQTPRDAYQNLIISMQNFVEIWVTPILRHNHLQKRSLLWAERNKQDIQEFTNYLIQCKDLYETLINFPHIDMDEEILLSYILRIILDVFAEGFSAVHPEFGRILDAAESSMRQNLTKGSLREFTIRAWRALGHDALLQLPEVKQARHEYRVRLLNRLTRVLGFVNYGKDLGTFRNAILAKIIDPALEFQEAILCSTSDISVTINTGPLPGKHFEGDISRLENVICTNIAKGGRYFSIDQLNPAPNLEQLQKELYVACSLIPAMIHSWVEWDTKKPLIPNSNPYKEHILVAWVSGKEGKQSMLEVKNSVTPWLHRILNISQNLDIEMSEG